MPPGDTDEPKDFDNPEKAEMLHQLREAVQRAAEQRGRQQETRPLPIRFSEEERKILGIIAKLADTYESTYVHDLYVSEWYVRSPADAHLAFVRLLAGKTDRFHMTLMEAAAKLPETEGELIQNLRDLAGSLEEMKERSKGVL